MATPTKEAEPTIYSMDEGMILAKMHVFMNGEPFHYLDMDTSIFESEREKRKAIVTTLTALVTDIRLKKKEGSALFDYQDIHFDEPDHVWLQEEHPGVNGSGWRVCMILMDPLKYGQNLDRPDTHVRGTISQRSTKN